MFLPNLWLYVLSTVALLLPGPTVLYIVTCCSAQGQRAGLVRLWPGVRQPGPCGGRHAGTVHPAVLQRALHGRPALRRRGTAPPPELGGHSQGQMFVHSALVNVLNPKIALFFVAFMPNFVSAGRGPLSPQFLMLGLLFVALACGTNALCSGVLAGHLRDNARFWTLKTRVSGGVYLGLGLVAALTAHG